MEKNFYKAMNYPNPQPEWIFSSKKNNNIAKKKNYATRDKKNYITGEFIETVEKYQKIYSKLPFVTHIYICNSLSFNAVKPESDIDLTIITKPSRMRTARLYSALIFWGKKIKRSKKKHIKRFCLSFYIDYNHVNLYNIKRPHADEYLVHRIAHLVPLYVAPAYHRDHILKENDRIRAQLPNIPENLPIELNKNRPIKKNSTLKKKIERMHSGLFGDIIEIIIKKTRKPIIKRKRKKDKRPENIIISDHMLKFHHDKRDAIHDIIKIQKDNKIPKGYH